MLAQPSPAATKPCPYCQSPAVLPAHTRIDGSKVLRCTQCELLFLCDLPTDIEALYGDDYFTKDASAPVRVGYSDYLGSASIDFLWQRSILTLFAGPGQGAALFDIGCALGRFLSLAQASGYVAEGLELNADAAARARALGFRVHQGTFAEVIEKQSAGAAKPLGPFSVITAWDVLEHVPDLREMLLQIRSLLAPGGYFLFSTPDAGSPTTRALGDAWPGYQSSLEHLTFLTRPFLSRALADVFGSEPLLLSFEYNGGYSTLIGIVRIGGLTHSNTARGALIEDRRAPDSAGALNEIGDDLGWLYLQMGAREALTQLLDRMQKSGHSTALLEAAALIHLDRQFKDAHERLVSIIQQGPPPVLEWQWLTRALDMRWRAADYERKMAVEHSHAQAVNQAEQLRNETAHLSRSLADQAALNADLLNSLSWKIGRGLIGVVQKIPFAESLWHGYRALRGRGRT